jgi:calcineurin-like phosphoesterase family protein
MIYFTGDHHFDHGNIIKYANRPFININDMNRVLINNWNSIVTKDDIVFHLGDFSFNETHKFLDELLGEIYFVKGNHDKQLINCLGVSRTPAIRDIKIDGYPPITLCHFSMRVWNKSHFGAYCLFGHSHGTLEPYKKSVDVGVDSHWITGKKEYRPFSIIEIDNYLKNREGHSITNG